MLNDFVVTIKQECVVDHQFFTFGEIPEVILKKNYARKDYEDIILKFLQKVQAVYLHEKSLDNPEITKDQLFITDEDLIKLEFLE